MYEYKNKVYTVIDDDCATCAHAKTGTCVLLQLLDAGYVRLTEDIFIDNCYFHQEGGKLQLITPSGNI